MSRGDRRNEPCRRGVARLGARSGRTTSSGQSTSRQVKVLEHDLTGKVIRLFGHML